MYIVYVESTNYDIFIYIYSMYICMYRLIIIIVVVFVVVVVVAVVLLQRL